ncbi:MAG: hypothetical protein AB2A00_09080 [Myxococcota bacterium]
MLVWGAGTNDAVGRDIGEFALDFGSPGAWVATGISDVGALWVRSTTGTSQGAYAGGLPPMSSPSAGNGVALFDSDYLDNNGVQGAFGTGPAPSPQSAVLVSPSFDLTGQQGATIFFARLQLFYRNFDITELSLGFSTDGGGTWDDFSLLQGVGTNQPFGTASIDVMLPGVLDGVTDLTNCQLRLTFVGDYYFAMVDDIALWSNIPPP